MTWLRTVPRTQQWPISRSLPPLKIDAFVYPAFVAVLMVPFGALSFGAAATLFTLILLAASATALYLLGVRDLRCYGAFFASPAALEGIRLGTLSPLLMLGLALVWVWRDKALRCGCCLAVVAASKLLFIPAGIWLLATRRFRALMWAAASLGLLLIGGWALIGFAGLRGYPTTLSTLSSIEAWRSYSVQALAQSLDLGGVWPAMITGGLGLVVVLMMAVVRHDDEAVYILAIGLCLLLSPILWEHYLCVLIIPIALRSPRFGWMWMLPLLLWLSPTTTDENPLKIGLLLGVVVAATIPGVLEAFKGSPVKQS